MMTKRDYTPTAEQWHQWLQHARRHFPALLRARPADSHKGSCGSVGLVGGARGMSGALALAAEAALLGGCGKVWAGFLQADLPLPYLPQRPEVMLDTAGALLARNNIDVWAAGCGLGMAPAAAALLPELMALPQALIVDADALNLLAARADWAAPMQARAAATILTPHPGEAARLLHCGIDDIQANRSRAATELAARYRAWVVLKGRHSLLASPAGHIIANPSGNAGLATAGSGDVLTGLLAGLLAQGLPLPEALGGGVWLHGCAAELLAASGCGPVGLVAGELADAVRWLRNRLVNAD